MYLEVAIIAIAICATVRFLKPSIINILTVVGGRILASSSTQQSLSLILSIAKVLNGENGCTVTVSGRYLKVEYVRDGNNNVLYLPYSRTAKRVDVEVLSKQGLTQVIKHPKGVPFMVTAKDLRAESVTIKYPDGALSVFVGDQMVSI